jgi:hypothetical protein
MSWTERLRRVLGDSHAELAEHLEAIHRGSADRAARLAAAAAAAPHAGAARELDALAAGERALAASVAEALAAHGGRPATAAVVSEGAGRNHWARLVGVLDACRDSHDEIVRLMPRLIALDPSIAGLVDALTRRLDAEIAELRNLIARADPQAVD